MAQDSFGGCCSFPEGKKCTIIWTISLSGVALLWSIIAGSFWSWITGIVAVSVVGAMACSHSVKVLAIVGAVFSFLSFLLMAIASIVTGVGEVCLYGEDDYYFDDNPCVAWAVMAGLGSLLWIAPGVLCLKLACHFGSSGKTSGVVVVQTATIDAETGGSPGPKEQPAMPPTKTEGINTSHIEATPAGGVNRVQETPGRTHRIEETPGHGGRRPNRIEETPGQGGRRPNRIEETSGGYHGQSNPQKVKILPPAGLQPEPDVYVERD